MKTKIGGIAWMRLTEPVIQELSSWDIVILNDANTFSSPEQLEAHLAVEKIKKLNPACKVLISFNHYSVFVKNGMPSAYFPVQQKIFEAANRHDAWLMVNGEHVSAWPGTWMYDLRKAIFRREVAKLINEYAAGFPDLDGVHFDELHRTLRFLPYPADQLPTDEEWEAATYSFLRTITLPYMGNGTYDLSRHHKTKSRGRYLQNAVLIPQVLADIKFDLELPIAQRWTVVNCTGPIVRGDWARLGYGTGVALQYHLPIGVTDFKSTKIEKFN